jgi:hypothetical protein
VRELSHKQGEQAPSEDRRTKMNENKTTELDVFDFALIRQGIVELVQDNTISETTALDLLDKLNNLRK